MESTSHKAFALHDFGIIDDKLSFQELLHTSYTRGREDVLNEMEHDFTENLQSAAQSSSLLKSKLKEKGIEVINMYLKVVDFEMFKCLVIVEKEHFLDSDKRKQCYKLANYIDSTNSLIELDFTMMPNSEHLEEMNITSDGFTFKYATKEV